MHVQCGPLLYLPIQPVVSALPQQDRPPTRSPHHLHTWTNTRTHTYIHQPHLLPSLPALPLSLLVQRATFMWMLSTISTPQHEPRAPWPIGSWSSTPCCLMGIMPHINHWCPERAIHVHRLASAAVLDQHLRYGKNTNCEHCPAQLVKLSKGTYACHHFFHSKLVLATLHVPCSCNTFHSM